MTLTEEDIKNYSYVVEDGLTAPEVFALGVQQLGDLFDIEAHITAGMLLACYQHEMTDDVSLKHFLKDWMNKQIEDV